MTKTTDDIFKDAFLTAVKGDEFDADEISTAIKEGFERAMLAAKKARDESTMNRLAAIHERLGF